MRHGMHETYLSLTVNAGTSSMPLTNAGTSSMLLYNGIEDVPAFTVSDDLRITYLPRRHAVGA